MRFATRLVALTLICGLVAVPWADAAATKPPSLATLLARHVPILVLHPDERFQPVAVDGFLADSDLTRNTDAGWVTVEGPLPAGGADLRLDQRLCDAIDGLAASSCYQAAEEAHGSGPVVYGAAFRTKTRIDLQYWLWYPYNDYSPVVPAADVWQVHEGDWESVSVVVDLRGKPLFVALSRHCAGARRDWARAPRRGRRPLVHVAFGSHANYFGVGTYQHDPACWPPELRDVVRALKLVDHTGAGREVRPSLVRVGGGRPSWISFAGAWGETGYVRFPNNPPVAYGYGPRGPAFHRQWQRPVVEAMSWPRG